MKKLRYKLGFTLAELTVVLGISAIAITMLGILVAGITKSNNRNNAVAEQRHELDDFKFSINDWFYKHDKASNQLSVLDAKELQIIDGLNTYSLKLDDGRLFIDAVIVKEFDTLIETKFYILEKLIKVEIVLEKEVIAFLLIKNT